MVWEQMWLTPGEQQLSGVSADLDAGAAQGVALSVRVLTGQ